MTAWRWVSRGALLLLHDESLAEHGGAPGIRDEGLLDSSLARPLQLAGYGEPPPDLPALAASCGVGLAKNRAFVDGNKRATFLAVGLFLAINSHRLVASQAEATLTMLAVAAGELDEAVFAGWIRGHLAPR